MIKAVLFDLDDTLIDINLGAFMARYLAGQARILSRVLRVAPPFAYLAVVEGYLRIDSFSRTDDLTSERLFFQTVCRRVGRPLDLDVLAEPLAYYDAEYIDRFRGGIVQAGPRAGSHEAIEAARSLGLEVALATNPVFSLAVDRTRMRWGEIDPAVFAGVSHWANSRRSKPCARYYQEFVSSLGLVPQECLMVGNDAGRDFPRPAIGMPTAYVGHGRPGRGVFRGSLLELAHRLPELVVSLNEREGRGAGGQASPSRPTDSYHDRTRR
ncbi:HAD family hydrolase [Olsenella sp. HMSC062G07]|uniref:HAD family hydrolase n=1 Tax=Olsenella sp. HMSC062G07 TaxID=1739330 RepID=UPI000B2436C5|nr:HAD family hydrolase [Olsenella sp. HMSC062G07]